MSDRKDSEIRLNCLEFRAFWMFYLKANVDHLDLKI